MTVLLAVLVVSVVAVAVAWPLVRPGPEAPADPIGPAAQLAALEERKRQLYGAIRELGFDYRTDKLEEADYDEEVERVKAEAVEVVRQIDEIKNNPPRGTEDLEAEIAALRGQAGAAPSPPGAPSATSAPAEGARSFCTQCGTPAEASDRFCSACGAPLRA
ncbi:MAG: zinc-ribbon domain-containing protein [Acidobacteriota bacterium]|jgi:hypothetical protein